MGGQHCVRIPRAILDIIGREKMKNLRRKYVQNQGLQGGVKKFWRRFG